MKRILMTLTAVMALAVSYAAAYAVWPYPVRCVFIAGRWVCR